MRKPVEQRTHKRFVESNRVGMSPDQVHQAKNARHHARREAHRAAGRQMETERTAHTEAIKKNPCESNYLQYIGWLERNGFPVGAKRQREKLNKLKAA